MTGGNHTWPNTSSPVLAAPIAPISTSASGRPRRGDHARMARWSSSNGTSETSTINTGGAIVVRSPVISMLIRFAWISTPGISAASVLNGVA